jgi:hypothetical protein
MKHASVGVGVLGLVVTCCGLLTGCSEDPAPYVQTKGGADVPAEKGKTQRFTFDESSGGLPGQFERILGDWGVENAGTAPSGPNVLKQRETSFISPDFPRVVLRDQSFTNLRMKVRCAMHSGDIDRACGIMFRFQDSDNYYVIRANAREDNVRLYHVIAGDRVQFGPDGPAPVPTDQWHTLGVEAQGTTIKVFFNEREVISATDSTFAKGKVGLWTKADSVTSFDDLEVTEL